MIEKLIHLFGDDNCFGEIKYVTTENYKNKILKHKVLGTLYRCNSCTSDMVFLHNRTGSCRRIDLTEIDLLFDVVGECKYSEEELDKMELEVKEEK